MIRNLSSYRARQVLPLDLRFHQIVDSPFAPSGQVRKSFKQVTFRDVESVSIRDGCLVFRRSWSCVQGEMDRLFKAVFLSGLGVCIYGCAGVGMMAAAGGTTSSRVAAEVWMGE